MFKAGGGGGLRINSPPLFQLEAARPKKQLEEDGEGKRHGKCDEPAFGTTVVLVVGSCVYVLLLTGTRPFGAKLSMLRGVRLGR